MVNGKTPGCDQILRRALAQHLTRKNGRITARHHGKSQQRTNRAHNWKDCDHWKGPKARKHTLIAQTDHMPTNNLQAFLRVLADQITQHLNQHDILACEQKGSWPGCRGINGHYLSTSAEARRRPIWLRGGQTRKQVRQCRTARQPEAGGFFKINHKLIGLVQQSVGNWNIALTSGGKRHANIKIKQGTYERNALSPLFFVQLSTHWATSSKTVNKGCAPNSKAQDGPSTQHGWSQTVR